MNEALVEIVLRAVKEQYVTEKAFYSSQLGISPQSWDRWKKGHQGLKADNMSKIAQLFTDYEWMLVQKVCRNAILISEVAENPVAEYMNMKYHVAKKWLNSGLATIEIRNNQEEAKEPIHRKTNQTIVRIEIGYDFWSYKDRIEMHLPGIVQQQIETEKQDLLEWFNQNVTQPFTDQKD
ncbi:hypothetical protein JTF06_05715 [Desemzia sp. RIT804]|uniref:hypothetical protein n=1 Tax=Desemzia sp. RIT 804 TaxID=2810209 RepID=UPI0019528ABC|nr:hypothetical protein [Desemzia sp. RIT 804]MBM6614383.1 hypothetical protein [Desemzia sp. RIT 804]